MKFSEPEKIRVTIEVVTTYVKEYTLDEIQAASCTTNGTVKTVMEFLEFTEPASVLQDAQTTGRHTIDTVWFITDLT